MLPPSLPILDQQDASEKKDKEIASKTPKRLLSEDDQADAEKEIGTQ